MKMNDTILVRNHDDEDWKFDKLICLYNGRAFCTKVTANRDNLYTTLQQKDGCSLQDVVLLMLCLGLKKKDNK